MRHGMVNRKLGRTSSHRKAMFRNQLASLVQHERIVTTLPKAKEIRPLIEKLVTLSKVDSVHNRRQAERTISDDTLVAKLFGTIGPRFTDRPGGYTRIIKLGARRGDDAEIAIIEFVGFELNKDGASGKTPAKKTAADAGDDKGKKGKAAPKADDDAGDDKPKKASKKKNEE